MISDSKKKIAIEELNLWAKKDMKGLILDSEERYHQQIREVAAAFAGSFPKNRIILLAGPSSSGKTTTSHILCDELKNNGINTVTVSFDDFFRPRSEAPRAPDGKEDLESPLCLDMECIENCVETLFTQKSCDFPIYDFQKGERSQQKKHLVIDDHTALVFEGLHAINPYISNRPLFQSSAMKIYISIKTEYYFEGKRIVDTRELRLVRRLIRDKNFRGCSPYTTLSMWNSVIAGEDRHIRPYRIFSDYWIDSVHLYEPYLYKGFLPDIFCEDESSAVNGYRKTANKLVKMLDYFADIPILSIPDNSLLREFIILP